jgi:hypothetical protein
VRCWLVVVVIACSSSRPTEHPGPRPIADARVVDTVAVDGELAVEAPAPSQELTLAERQQQLGEGATTCFGVANILAAQGHATDEHHRAREKAIRELCVADKWPERVRECVARATHDPLSCTGYLSETQKQKWNPIFENW